MQKRFSKLAEEGTKERPGPAPATEIISSVKHYNSTHLMSGGGGRGNSGAGKKGKKGDPSNQFGPSLKIESLRPLENSVS